MPADTTPAPRDPSSPDPAAADVAAPGPTAADVAAPGPAALDTEVLTTEAAEPAALETEVLETEVLVVGAGPTGLMAGLVLHRRGIGTLVIDPKAGPTHESRAIVVQARSMEIYDQLGLAGQVMRGANPAGRLLLGADNPTEGADFFAAQNDWTPFPGAQIFEQSRNEELLAGTLAAEGRPTLWGHGLRSLEELGEHVEALVDGPDGPLRIRARYLIGADGASSPVRHQLGLPFEGVTDEATFCVADLRGAVGVPDDTLVFRFGQQRFAISFPLGPGGHVRLIWLHGTAHPDQETAMAGVREDFGLTYERLDWFSAYRVHHRVAPHFRRGRVLLAGDAAHVHSPVGGQGMNTGLQDAHHLGNLLADVLTARLGPAALDRYERERRPVAMLLIKATDRAFGVIARPGRRTAFVRRQARRVAAPLGPRLLASRRLGPYLAGLLGQYRIRYRAAPKGERPPRWTRDRAVGVRLPPTPENTEALRAMEWQLHSYGADAARPTGVPDWIAGPHAFAPDPLGRLRRDRLYLVRPDGFVAASWPVHAGAAAVADVRETLAAYEVLG